MRPVGATTAAEAVGKDTAAAPFTPDANDVDSAQLTVSEVTAPANAWSAAASPTWSHARCRLHRSDTWQFTASDGPTGSTVARQP